MLPAASKTAVTGLSRGMTFSKNSIIPVYSTEQYAVLNVQLLPRIIKPSTSRKTFIKSIITAFVSQGTSGVMTVDSIIEIPPTPPRTKLYGI